MMSTGKQRQPIEDRARPSDAALAWEQFRYGVGFLVVLSPIVIGVPLAILSVALAIAPHPRAVAIVAAGSAGFFLGLTLYLLGTDSRSIVLFTVTGLVWGIVIRLPPQSARMQEKRDHLTG